MNTRDLAGSSHESGDEMTATRAAVLREFGRPQQVEEVELRPPGPGEARVRLLAAGVCHSDVGQASGEWECPLPIVLGHEGCAVVEAVGADVSLAVGARVLLSLAPGCGLCAHCEGGHPIRCQVSLRAMGEGRLTTGSSPLRHAGESLATYSLLSCFAERAVVSGRSLIPIADDVPAEVAALVGCAVITGAGATIATIDVPAGSRGAVIGVGGVGVNAVAGARARGAAEIVAFDPSEERRESARRFGASAAVDVADADLIESLRAAAPDSGFDWTVVTVGSPEAMRLGVDLLRPGGQTAIVGLAPQGVPVPIDMLDLVTYERRIVGSAYGTISPRLLVPRILQLYRQGLLPLDELVSHRFPLEGINEAFELSARAGGLRAIIEFDGA
jgi:S-(hydroxymethyl)glutathione dehydrogenase/alcohol dehydrogenase